MTSYGLQELLTWCVLCVVATVALVAAIHAARRRPIRPARMVLAGALAAVPLGVACGAALLALGWTSVRTRPSSPDDRESDRMEGSEPSGDRFARQFGAWLGSRLAFRNLNARQLAGATGISHTAIYRYLKGV